MIFIFIVAVLAITLGCAAVGAATAIATLYIAGADASTLDAAAAAGAFLGFCAASYCNSLLFTSIFGAELVAAISDDDGREAADDEHAISQAGTSAGGGAAPGYSSEMTSVDAGVARVPAADDLAADAAADAVATAGDPR